MRIHIPIQVRWSDLDAYGHVNNATMLTLLEEARVHGFWANDEAEAVEGAQVFSSGPNSHTFTLIARQEIEYLLPIPHLRDPIQVEMWVSKIGGASLDVSYEIFSPVGQEPRELYSRAMTVIVIVDSSTMRPRKLTELEKSQLEKYLEPAIEFNRR